MPAPAFAAPPHPVPVFRVLKQAYRNYLNGGTACSIDITTPPNQLASATTVVAGTVWVPNGVRLPASVTVTLTQVSTVKGTRVAAVNPTTGVYSTTFPGATLVAGSAFATVVSATPADTTITPTFTVT